MDKRSEPGAREEGEEEAEIAATTAALFPPCVIEEQPPTPVIPEEEEEDVTQSEATNTRTEELKTDDLTTPESSLTNLIRDVKSEIARAADVPVTRIIETVEVDEGKDSMEQLLIEEDHLDPVMCANLPFDCKTISPSPSCTNDEFEIPEIENDIINTIFSDPPPFNKK